MSTVGPTLTVGPPKPFDVVDGLERTIYTTAGVQGGVEVFGRGHRIVVTVRSGSADAVELTEVALVLVDRQVAHRAELRYHKLEVGVPATRLPAPVLNHHIRWTEHDQPGVRKTAFDGPSQPLVGQFDITIDVEAAAPGLWEYAVEATIRDGNTETVTVSCASRLAVLLRGT